METGAGIGADSQPGMHHHSQLLVTTPQKVDAPFDDKPRLPTELLLLVVSYIQNSKDLAVLCRVSKQFRAICRPLLYKVVNIVIWEGKEEVYLRFCREVHKSSLSHLITEFSITITSGAFCRKWDRNNFCTCDKHDQDMARFIQSLSRLQSLTVICYLCRESHDHRHFHKLRPPMLRELNFECSYSNESIHHQSILRAPLMSKITALTLGTRETWSSYRGRHREEHAEIMQDTNILSDLVTLNHGGNRLCDIILSQRPVQRLCYPRVGSNRDDSHLDGPIRESPGTLSHLFTFQLFHWLPSHMEPDRIEPYRNLRFIGMLTCTKHREDDALVEMEILAPLTKLEFMEINQRRYPDISNPPEDDFTPSRHFVERLGYQHERLCRVLLQRQGFGIFPQDAILWEKSQWDGWKSRRVPPLEFWDIVHDKLDEV